jgi:hypothetical protein
MTAIREAARKVETRLSPNAVALDPSLSLLLEQAIAYLVDAIRSCYATADGAWAYLQRDFGPLQWWREGRRTRLVNEAVDAAVAEGFSQFPGSKTNRDAVVAALRTAVRDDLSRGLLTDLYEARR